MSKIGKTILIAVDMLLLVVAAAVTVAFCILFTNVETKNLQESARIASNVLEFDIQTRAAETGTLAKLLADDANFRKAVEEDNEAVITSTWESITKSPGMFGVFVNSDGIIAMQTENCSLSPEGIFDALGASKNGLASDSQLYLYYRSISKNEGVTVIIGYSYSDTAAVDGVMDQTGSHATIFYDNLRISTTLTDENGERVIGTTMFDDIYEKVVKNGEVYQHETKLFGKDYMATYTPIIDDYGVIKGAYFTGCPMENMIANRNRAVVMGIIVSFVVIIFAGILVIVFVKKRLAAPIVMVKNMAVEMERGNLKNNPGINGKIYNNEIGELAEAINEAISNLDVYISDISERMSEMSEGNFAYSSDVEYHGDFVNIGRSADELASKMKDVIQSINVSSDEVYSGSEQIANGASSLAEGTTRQAAATEELSASLNEISDNIALNAENAEKAQKLSDNSIQLVNDQNVQIGNMLEAMSNIESSAGEINKIIKAIEDIAFQTNILALNAAVEAARAGAAGKGFAVVADEVRNLANKSAEAAKTTSALIGSCIEAVDNGSSIAKGTAEAMAKVIEITNETNRLIDSIAQQTIRQSEAVHQVKSGIDQISEVVQQNSATAEESAASCEELNSQAMALRDKISIFRT
ncbi:MAG: methyl-accepting chemotaxis protein [Oscillospiraceae bacterium]